MSSPCSQYVVGQKVQMFSQSNCGWMTGTVVGVEPDGTVEANYLNTQGQNMRKKIPPPQQSSLLRPA